MITQEQAALVQETWNDVLMVAEPASAMFYSRLFAIDPEASALFAAADMRKQREKLFITLNQIVTTLQDPDPAPLLASLDELGQRHRAYGVTASHYNTVGESLLWMLNGVLGSKFTPAVSDAWAAAYSMISERMQSV